MLGIIPARYASTRFPAKALVDIGGKSMIQRVYEQATKAQKLNDVVVATDHERIVEEVQRFGGNVVMTAEQHPSGTDRCFEAFKKWNKDYEFVLNIQGDEPFINPDQIDLLAETIEENRAELATLVVPVKSSRTLFNPNTVQVVLNNEGQAMYFSRSPIPHLRNTPQEEWYRKHTFYKHVGIYAYRADILEKITLLEPSSLEKAEMLEQLRWLENGFKIQVGITNKETFGVDTPEDLERLKKEKNLF